MEHLNFLQDLALVMTVGAIITVFCHIIRLPLVLGYLLAGAIIGPYTPPFPLITNVENIRILSELGIIFLLFSIGLEFSFSKLMRVGFVAFFAATFEILLMIWLGFIIGQSFGWDRMDSLFLGAILCVSSTTIIAKVLFEMKKFNEKFAQVILGILIIEDILAIVIIAILSGIASTGNIDFSDSWMAFLKVGGFMTGILVVGFLTIPKLLQYVERLKSAETTIITILGLCFGTAYIAEKMGFSVALGSFLIGAIIAETKQAHDISKKIEPIRDMFTAIFFVSVGMLLQPQLLVTYAGPIAVITLVTILGKVAGCSFATFLTGHHSDVALKVGLGLAQIGEFSFIIAQLGESANVTSSFLYPIAVAVSGITTLTTPFLMRSSDHLTNFLKAICPKPLATFLGLYTSRIQRIGGFAFQSSRIRAVTLGLKKYVPRLFLYSFGALISFWGYSFLQDKYEFFALKWSWIFLVILLLPMLGGAAYTLDRILWNVLFLNLIKSREMTATQEANQTLHNVFRFLVVFFIGISTLAFGSVFFPSFPLALVVIGLILIAGLLLWGSVRQVHDRFEKMIFSIFDKEEPVRSEEVKKTHDELIQLIRKQYPWEVATEDFLVPFTDTGLSCSIRALHLRSKTGTSIIAIYRSDQLLPNPPPETKISPGDVLLLMGTREQIEQGIHYLQEKANEPPATEEAVEDKLETRKFDIPPDSHWVGQTLQKMKLRSQTNVTVLGIQKQGSILSNPGPDVSVDAGDQLILFGLSSQIDKAVIFLNAKA